ncbi:FIST N domain protein [Planctomycetes bacterium Poly30]|uniref:FIST N domain protein n=1 Tax=Saltatorellus ferox TaxID=2528018 RepID=A0A518ELE0_9BACT|nr:FIST N domain protein [Planctomycetes bacterium Poly30]
MTTKMGSALIEGMTADKRGRTAVLEARMHLGEHVPSLAVAFLSEGPDMEVVLRSIRAELGDVPLVGCSSSGEFTDNKCGLGGVSLSLIASDRMEIRIGVGDSYVDDIQGSVDRATAGFKARSDEAARPGWRGRTLMLFVDGLAGKAEDLVDELIAITGMQYQLFGGAAADQVRFERTSVFHGERVLSGAFVCVEILSEKPFGVGMSHGWDKAAGPFRVTASTGNLLHEINGIPARELYADYAVEQGLDTSDETIFLMQNIIGIEDGDNTKLRVPLAVEEDGTLICSTDVPTGAVVYIMRSDLDHVLACTEEAIERASEEDPSCSYAGALLIGCVATRLQLGDSFSSTIARAAEKMGTARIGGCAAFGQIARIGASFTGRQSAASVVCLIPE